MKSETKDLVAELREIANGHLLGKRHDLAHEAADRLEELERDHGKPTDAADPNGSTCARLKWWKDRNDDLHDQLAAANDANVRCSKSHLEQSREIRELRAKLAAKDAHADQIYKAAVELAAKLEGDLEDARQLNYEKACILDHLAEKLDLANEATDDDIEFAAIEAISELAAERALADRLAGKLDDIAKQLLADEMDDHSSEHADWEGGYEMCVEVAREALASWKQARGKEA